MWPGSFWNGSFWPASYWPKLGGIVIFVSPVAKWRLERTFTWRFERAFTWRCPNLVTTAPTLPFYAGEDLPYAFDFSRTPLFASLGDSIASIVVTQVVAPDTALVVASTTFSNNTYQVTCVLQGGTSGQTYQLLCTVTTTLGYTLKGYGWLAVA